MPWIEQLQSANWNQACCIALVAYGLGCFTTGYYVVRHRTGQDLRLLGSGSVGAKNAGRVLGPLAFVLTLLGDFSKGLLAVWATRHFTTDERWVTLGLLAVVSGHVWPAQLGFRGGKGVATSLGGLLVYDFHLAVAYALLFLGPFLVLRKTVLPGLFAFLCLPLISAYLAYPLEKTLGVALLAGLILLAHRKNLVDEILRLANRRNLQSKSDHTEL
jgi:glycerol-3-phosphate acyltransferase PlsY